MISVCRRDENFLDQCKLVAKNSKCLSRQIGSILVRDKSIISTGYNGPPRDFPHCNERYLIDPELRKALKKINKDPDDPRYHNICPRYVLGYKSGQGLEWCVAAHSEKNAIVNAAREGICTKGSTLYMTCSVPCSQCLVSIINAGITEIVVTSKSFYDLSAQYLIKNSNLICREFHITTNFE